MKYKKICWIFSSLEVIWGGKKDVEEIVVQTIDNEAPMQHYDLLPKVIKVWEKQRWVEGVSEEGFETCIIEQKQKLAKKFWNSILEEKVWPVNLKVCNNK